MLFLWKNRLKKIEEYLDFILIMNRVSVGLESEQQTDGGRLSSLYKLPV